MSSSTSYCGRSQQSARRFQGLRVTHLDSVDEDLDTAIVTKQLKSITEAVKDVIDQLHGFRYHCEALGQTILNDLDEEGDEARANYHISPSGMRCEENHKRQ